MDRRRSELIVQMDGQTTRPPSIPAFRRNESAFANKPSRPPTQIHSVRIENGRNPAEARLRKPQISRRASARNSPLASHSMDRYFPKCLTLLFKTLQGDNAMPAKSASSPNPDPGFNPKVDLYIAHARPFAQPILNHLRELVHQACPGVEETMKWSRPFFEYQGVILGNMSAFNAHCSFGFWGQEIGAVLREAKVLHPQKGKGFLCEVAAMLRRRRSPRAESSA